MNRVGLFLYNKLFFILCLISIVYTLPSYNKFWAPCDEGIILVAAQRLLGGEVPYKDFFIVMYPPGQIYVLFLLFKIFSASIIAGRIYTVLISVGSSLLVFEMTRLLTRNVRLSIITWFFAMVSLAPRLGAIPSPIWPGVFLALLGLYTYMLYLENQKVKSLFFTGCVIGLSILFRHDIGIFAFISVLFTILISRRSIKDALIFFTGNMVFILPSLLYFMSKSASQDIVNSLMLFPFVHKETAGIPFPRACFDLNMIFHGSLHFIKVNQYYIPLLIYAFIFIYLIYVFFKKKLFEKENIMLLTVLLFGIFTFNQVIIRTDPAHLLTVIQAPLVLFGFMMHKTFFDKPNLRFSVLLRYGLTLLVLVLFSLLTVKNIDKYVKNNFRKPYKGDIIATRFEEGVIYIPRDEKSDVLSTLEYIEKHTAPNERIYVGNTAHWKDDFGGSVILYYLANRLPSTKYYELLPGLVTDPRVQHEIKNSLLYHDVRLLVLQDIDLKSSHIPHKRSQLRTLDNYIEKHYVAVAKFGKYNIFMKQKEK